MPNRLARERSPYLRQHANNPVDWFPWGDEAFGRARAEDKPIFLSVGYSTCHWCHVMEHESFEDAEVARVLNDGFVAIKVDREERPDVDRVYMLFVQATTGAGGWPMSVWLTPGLKPFFGGTYFPPTSRWGRPAFVDVLRELSRLWQDDRARLVDSAESITERLRTLAGPGDDGARVPPLEQVQAGAQVYRQIFDRRHGGFGGAPKFPRPSEVLFLLRAWHLGADDIVRGMVLDTMRAMALGGMYDHVGGGFHRYAVDAEWRVPHFEKMLYDQAQLVLALLETAQASGESFWRWVAAETLTYVERDLTHPAGAFFSAEDADSLPPDDAGDPQARKSEGAFYLWGADEIDRHLGRDAEVVRLLYGVEAGGNAPHDPQGEFGSKNILYVARSVEDVAQQVGHPSDEVMDAIVRGRRRLLEVRGGRPRPHLDDKVLSAWNGLMIAACARAARVLEGDLTPDGRDARAHYAMLGTRAAQFVRRHLWDAAREVLLRCEPGDTTSIDGFAEDYAGMVWGLLELFQATGEPEWLEWALQLQHRQDALFWDEESGGWFSTTGQDAAILLRLKEEYDGAEPSASSVAVSNLLILSHLVQEPAWHGKIERVLARLGTRPAEVARQSPFLMSTLPAWHHGLLQVVIVGQPAADDTAALRRVVARHYLPFSMLVPVEPGDPQAALAERLSWVRAMAMREGRATAYVCRAFACEAPVTSPEALDALLAPLSRAEAGVESDDL